MEIRSDFSDHRFRPSQMGKIMTGVDKMGLTEKQEETYAAYLLRFKGEGRPLTENQMYTFHDLGIKKTEKPKLAQTAESELKKIHNGLVMNRRKNIQTIMMEKGTIAEEKSITLDSNVAGALRFKNKERKQNDWFNGEADNVQGMIRDYKSSWDFETFPIHKESAEKDYQYQGNCYMDLWELDECEIIHCLVDTPPSIVQKDLHGKHYKYDLFDGNGDIREDKIDLVVELVSNHIYSEKGLIEYCNYDLNIEIDWFKDFVPIPEEIRRKVFHFKRDDILIESMKKQIVLAREYLSKLSDQMISEMNLEVVA